MPPRTNTLTQGDLAQITNIVRTEVQVVRNEVQNVKDEVLKHKLVLFGPDEESGIVKQVESHDALKKKIGPLAAVGSLLASAAGYWIPKIFGK
jgi:hypothetical protein